MPHSITRYHDISVGHRVHGHESKCAHLHGHNYRVHFTVEVAVDLAQIIDPDTLLQMSEGQKLDATIKYRSTSSLDDVGRVLDFSAVKSKLCMWLEDNWDHKFLAWENDLFMSSLYNSCMRWGTIAEANDMMATSIVWVPFNPTAENMAQYLVDVIGPAQLVGTGCVLTSCIVEETAKCSAKYSLG